MKKLASKCACSASGIGICLCIVFMTISVVGTTLVGISKNANSMTGMGSMSDMATTSQNVFVKFFSGVWGEVILLVSFGLMFYGMWSGDCNRKKIISFISSRCYHSLRKYVCLLFFGIGDCWFHCSGHIICINL